MEGAASDWVEVSEKASSCRKHQRGARFEEGGKSGYRVEGCRADVAVHKLQECEMCGYCDRWGHMEAAVETKFASSEAEDRYGATAAAKDVKDGS